MTGAEGFGQAELLALLAFGVVANIMGLDLKAGRLNVLDSVFAAAATGGLPNLQPWPGGAWGLGLAGQGCKTQQRADVG